MSGLGLFSERTIEEAGEMRLGRFTVSALAVEIGGSFLPGRTWIAADRAVAASIREEHPEAAVYTGTELWRLADANPARETLLIIHEAKQVFGGRLVKFRRDEKRDDGKQCRKFSGGIDGGDPEFD